MKLVDLLREANIIKVPEEVLSKLPGIYKDLDTNFEEYLKQAPKSYLKPLIPSKFDKVFKFKDLAGKDLEVSVGLYNDEDDSGGGRMDTVNDIMLINLAFLGDEDAFLELGEHELVHAMDPKVRDQKLFGVQYAKKGADPNKNLEKYTKSPWEFDAFTAPLLNKLKKGLDRSGNKEFFKTSMMKLLSAIPKKSVEDIMQDDELLRNAWFFSTKEWTQENWPGVSRSFYTDIQNMKMWASKPTLYKRFLQRYATVVK